MPPRTRSPRGALGGPRSWQPSSEAARNAGHSLLHYLLQLYSTCKLSATDLTTVCFYLDKGGFPGGAFDRYAVDPTSAGTGNPQRHLDRVIPIGGELMVVALPSQYNSSSDRGLMDTPIRCLWTSIEDEMADNPSIRQFLDSDPEGRQPSCLDTAAYAEHPAVLEAARCGRPRPLPLALYADGVTFVNSCSGRNESCLGLWIENCISRSKHFMVGVRSGDLCSCGCRGHCTIAPIIKNLECQLFAMQSRKIPGMMPDGQLTSTFSKKYLPHTELTESCLLYVKGDWAEFQHTLSLAGPSSKWSPCPLCQSTQDELFDHVDSIASDEGPGWLLKDHDHYEMSCRRCEINVALNTREDVDNLVGTLRWEKPSKGIGGRMVFRPGVIQGTEIQIGDRLEPSADCWDIARLSDVRTPANVVLWRTRRDSEGRLLDPVVHRCPLFSTRLHTSPHRTLAIDSLHTIFLGPALRYCSSALWRIVLRNPWRYRGDVKVVIDNTVAILNAELQKYQSDPSNAIPIDRRIGKLTPKMLGDRKGRTPQDCVLFLFVLTCSVFSINTFSLDVSRLCFVLGQGPRTKRKHLNSQAPVGSSGVGVQ